MRDVELSPSAQELLRAAKSDAPSAAARARIWSNVATTAKLGAGAAAAGGAGKLLMIGTIFGTTMTVGLAAILMHVGAASAPAPVRARVAGGVRHETRAAAALPEVRGAPDEPEAQAVVAATSKAKVAAPRPLRAPGAGAAPAEVASPSASPSGAAVAAAPVVADEDPLMREASIVAEARGALMRGDAAGALAAVQIAKSLPARQLQPEELALEAKALEALGHPAEARTVGAALKTRYPDNALAR